MAARHYLIGCIVLIYLAGCASAPAKTASAVDQVPKVSQSRYPDVEPAPTAEGSLWSEASGLDLFPDRRARKVGDVVTVRIVEDPEAELTANTKTSRSSNVTAAKLKMLGYMQALADKNSRLAQNPGTDDLFSAALGMDFDGQGSTDRDGEVKAYIAAVVEKVFRNGNLYINGTREIRVNNETQYITFSGIARPEDISTDNEISSTYVASAKITYSGKGPVADKQKPGWLGRIVDHVWPF